jgi:hypothetical protein
VKPLYYLLLIAAALLAAPPAQAEDPYWTVDLSFLGGYNNNFFYRAKDTIAPTSTIWTAAADVRYDREVGNGDLTLLLGGIGDFVTDIPNADYQTVSVGALYKYRATKFSLIYDKMFNRLYSELGDISFFDQEGYDFWARHSFNRRVWLRLRLRRGKQDFDPIQNDRDADLNNVSLTARVGLNDQIALRGSILYENREARSPENSRTGSGWSIALESKPNDRINLFLRLRQRRRDYDLAPPDDSNFGRRDTVSDLNLNLRIKVKDSWGVMLRDQFRDGESTRPDRNFNGNYFSAGIFYTFGGEDS